MARIHRLKNMNEKIKEKMKQQKKRCYILTASYNNYGYSCFLFLLLCVSNNALILTF